MRAVPSIGGAVPCNGDAVTFIVGTVCCNWWLYLALAQLYLVIGELGGAEAHRTEVEIWSKLPLQIKYLLKSKML